jgi:hypothetical protein
VIDARLDIFVWVAVLLLLILMGVRAWAVETGTRDYRTSARVRTLTAGTVLALFALVGIVGMQGGIVFVQSVATRTDPQDTVILVNPDGTVDPRLDGPEPPPDPNVPPADPNAPPPDPNAPGAVGQDGPPAVDQGAPAGGAAGAPPAAGG